MYNTRKVVYTTWRPRCRPSRCLRAACSILVSLAFSLIAANGAKAATYYVDDANGSDSNPGTESEPWETIPYTWSAARGGNTIVEGDTVLFKNGDYGRLKESTGTNPGEYYLFYRDDWITYKAAPGHSPSFSSVYIFNKDKWRGEGNGRSYIAIEGFNIKNTVRYYYTSYVKVVDCNITANPVDLEGFYAPYTAAGRTGVNAQATHQGTVQDCNIHQITRGISLEEGALEYWTIKDNLFHRIAEDGINAGGTSHLLVEGNKVYDIHKGRTGHSVVGTGVGTFEVGEVVIQADTNAQGVVYELFTTNKIGCYTTTKALFQKAGYGGGTVTGQSSNATMSDITKVDYSHSDCMHWQRAGTATDIVIRGNTFVPGVNHSGCVYIYCYGTYTDVTIENNLAHATARPSNGFILGGVAGGLKINNNTFGDGFYLGFYGDTTVPSLIDEFYNNVMLSYSQATDVNESVYTRVLSHGNNIFGSNPNGKGGPAYPFALNSTEAISSNLNALFTNAAANDYTLAADSAAIDFGNANYGPSTDKDGNSRVGAPDAGCYEYTPSGSDNNAPVLSSIGAKSVDENALLNFSVSAMTEVSYSFRTEMRSFGTNKLLGSDVEGLDKAAPATAADDVSVVMPAGGGNIVEFLVPYIALAVMMAILKRRDANNRKAGNVAKGDH